MDLNMIKGLGPTFRQTMYKNGVLNVEQLVKILPSKIEFFEPSKLSTINKSEFVTLEVSVTTYIENADDSEKLNFTVNCDGEIVNASVKSRYFYKKQLIPGKKLRIRGFFDVDNRSIDIDTIFDIDAKIFQTFYEVGDLPSSQIHNFSEKGLTILNEFDNEIPACIKEKLGVKSYSDILVDIHLPKSCEVFIKALENYTYELLFNFFISYYYYILSTSLPRSEECNFDINKISAVINDFGITQEQKKNLNLLLNEFKKPFYTNVLFENICEEDKKITTLISIISKVSLKKQIVIIAKENFEYYKELKEILLKYHIKTDIMARKGRNKENFESFNTGKYDVLITLPVNFETLSTKDIGMIICDDESFEVANRLKLNCNNADTLFYTNSTLSNNFNRKIFKNITPLNEKSDDSSIKDTIFNNILTSDNYSILSDLLEKESIERIVDESSIDAYDFIKNKKFKENKENFEYFKKLMDSLSNQ